MPLSVVRVLPTVGSGSGNGSIAVSNAIPVGSLLVVGAFHAGGTAITLTVTDTRGNTWTPGRTQVAGGNGAQGTLRTYYCIVTTQIQAGDTITLDWSDDGFFERNGACLEISGNATASVLDGENSGVDGTFPTSTPLNSGSISTTNANDILVGFGVVTFTSDTFQTLADWTEQADFTGGSGQAMVVSTRIVSATGSYSFQPAPTAGANYWVASIHAFKEAGPTTQVLRPSADSVDGAWTDQGGGTTLYAAIDEVTPSDTDYIRSPLSPATENGTRIKISTGSTPQAGTRTLSWRIGKDQTGGDTINMKLQLRQGGGDSLGAGTLVQEFTRNGVDAATRYDETVTGTITNYADLYLEFYAVKA